jgi:hypothetical protein
MTPVVMVIGSPKRPPSPRSQENRPPPVEVGVGGTQCADPPVVVPPLLEDDPLDVPDIPEVPELVAAEPELTPAVPPVLEVSSELSCATGTEHASSAPQPHDNTDKLRRVSVPTTIE